MKHDIPTEFEFEPGFDHTQVNALNPTFLSPTFSGPVPVATQTSRLSYLQATPAPSLSTAISTGSDAARNPAKVAFWKDSSRHGFNAGQLTKITKTGVLIYVGHMDGFQEVGTADTVFELTGGGAVGIFQNATFLSGATTCVKSKVCNWRSADLTTITVHLKDHYGLGALTSVDLVARLSELIGPNDGQYSQVIHTVDQSGAIVVAFGNPYFLALSNIMRKRIGKLLDKHGLTEADLAYGGNPSMTDGGRAFSKLHTAFILVVALKKLNPLLTTKRQRDEVDLSRSCHLELAKELSKIARVCGLIVD